MKLSRYIKEFEIDEKNKLIMNTMNGAVDIIEKDIYEKISNGIYDESNKDICDALKIRGYLINNPDDDYKLLKEIMSLKEDVSVATFIICTTYTCNLGCTYCFEPKEVKQSGKVLGVKEVNKIFEAINTIKEERGFDEVSILLYGGEPFLSKTEEIVKYIFKKAEEEGYLVEAITNGTQINQFKSIFVKYKKMIDGLQITLDGIEEIHNNTRKYLSGAGTFRDIEKNIDMCIELGIPIALRINTGKRNVAYVKDFLEFIKDKKWIDDERFTCQFAPVADHYCTNKLPDWMPEHLIMKEIIGQLNEVDLGDNREKVRLGIDMEKRTSLLRCVMNGVKSDMTAPLPCSAACRNYFIFGAEGLIYACPETVGMKKYSIGSYTPILDIDKKKEDFWRRDISNIEKCSNCNIAGICGSGCTWSSIATNGEEFKEAQCNYAMETIDTFFELNREKIKKLI